MRTGIVEQKAGKAERQNVSSPRNDPQETILVVDDEAEIVQFVQDALEDEGYTVWTAFDGRTAVKEARQRNPDLIILDIMLPGCDGFAVCNELGDLCSAFNELRCELQRSLEREWRKQEEMRTMIAALSHDLRTPVTIIQGHIESLVRADAGEKRNQRLERYLPVLESSSQRMARLLNDLLLVSSLEEAGFVIQPQPVQLAEALERKAVIYRLQAATHDIAFSYGHEDGHALAHWTGPVLLDLHRLEQVLDNLFENALRSTPAHGQISLTCTQQTDQLLFLLRDTGCGIAPTDLPHVFEKFYHGQARPGEKARKASGLGLYTCKLLIERHGGTIALQNHPAGGCEVAFCLPLNAAHGSFADGNEDDES
jgi:two-component system, OmpR family, lantibiotic biosynthesis sensor histidine kinase NisK/SpaK